MNEEVEELEAVKEVEEVDEVEEVEEVEEVDEKKGNVQNQNLFAMLGMEQPKKKEEPVKKKAAASTASAPVKKKEKKIEKDKIKIVKAYGEEVFTIEKGQEKDIEEIRQYLVETLGFREFQKEETEFSIINDGDETQYIIPHIKFKAKG